MLNAMKTGWIELIRVEFDNLVIDDLEEDSFNGDVRKEARFQ